MVLVDASVWVAHLREGNIELAKLLDNAQVMCHPFIIGEIACGNLRNRNDILSLLKNLPLIPQISHEEVLYFIESRSLMGKGLGYVDMHLSASASLAGITIWTLDKRFAAVNKKLHLGYPYQPDAGG